MQIQVEVSSLVAEIDRIASTAQFNGMNILTGRFASEGLKFQVGANMDQSVTAHIGTMTATALGLKGSQGEESNMISVSDVDSANMTAKVVALPEREEIATPVEEHLIVEFYSK